MLPERRSMCVHLIWHGVSCVNQTTPWSPTFEMTLVINNSLKWGEKSYKKYKVKSNPSKCNIPGFIDFSRIWRGCVDLFCMFAKCVRISVHLIWHGVSCVNQTTPWSPTFEMTLVSSNSLKRGQKVIKCNIPGFIDFSRILRGCVDLFCMFPKCVWICVHLIWHGVSCVNQTRHGPQHLRLL